MRYSFHCCCCIYVVLRGVAVAGTRTETRMAQWSWTSKWRLTETEKGGWKRTGRISKRLARRPGCRKSPWRWGIAIPWLGTRWHRRNGRCGRGHQRLGRHKTSECMQVLTRSFSRPRPGKTPIWHAHLLQGATTMLRNVVLTKYNMQ